MYPPKTFRPQRYLLPLLMALPFLAIAEEAPTPAPAPEAIPALPALKIKDAHFRDESGHIVRFWGMNLVSLYPTHAQSDVIAARLADFQINLVRPHHLLRKSKDWNPGLRSGAIVTYEKNSLDFDPEALDRFDYLNAALRKRGIYLAMSLHFSRVLIPEDVDILKTDPEDRAAWMKGIEELNSWDWKKGIDPKKLLPVVDERAALISEEFNRRLLTHENPYTKTTYAKDSQVLSLEVLNEASLEYAIVCGNRFPDYFQKRLEDRWKAYLTEKGIEYADLYAVPKGTALREARSAFLTGLDEAYFLRMKAFLASIDCQVPLTYSNLWRGDATADMHSRHAEWIENHAYADPRLAQSKSDGVYEVGKSALAGKPFFIGELNQAEGEAKIEKMKPYRTQLQAGMVAYALLQDWDGLEWFAWAHGDQHLGADGLSAKPGRDVSLGEMMHDTTMQDHLRTLGHVFRRQLIRPSVTPVTMYIQPPFATAEYNALMRGKFNYKAGWQSIHGVRRAYGPVPAEQSKAAFMTTEAPSPQVSDTGEIVKDTKRRQITVAAPQVEIITGNLDGEPVRGPKHLKPSGKDLFTTLVLVALDDKPIAESRHLLLSRTLLDKELRETSDPALRLEGLAGEGWSVTVTRSRTGELPAVAPLPAGGELGGDWTECELRLP